MIIDCRLRPPYKSYLKTSIPFDLEFVGAVCKKIGLEPPKSAHSRSMDELIEEMKDAGISKALVIGRDSPNWGTVPNDEIKELVSKYPELFLGVGAVSARPISKALEEIERCINDLGLVGICMDPGQENPPLKPNDAPLYPIYALCQKLNTPIMMTVNIIATPYLEYAFPAHIDQVAVDFPDLKIVVEHACYPWVTQILGVAYWRPNVFIMPDLYIPYVPWGHEYVRTANEYLQDQILFGSSYPVASLASMVEGYKKAPFEPKVLEKVFYKNAAKLFNIK
jgi:predicted TIM-barrel fold metal-dependent hydrolase